MQLARSASNGRPDSSANVSGRTSPTPSSASDVSSSQQQARSRGITGENIERKYASGSKYVGGFRNGRLHGYGVYSFEPSGDVYEGEWENDLKHGKGTYKFNSGDRYVGDWLQGKKNGKGSYFFQNGDKYVGTFKNDNLHGTGTFTSHNGETYTGSWMNNFRHGHGTAKKMNGEVYEGQFAQGKEEGLGILTLPTRDVYCGSWKGGSMNGNGIFLENGRKHTVLYEDGCLLSKTPLKEGDIVEEPFRRADDLFRLNVQVPSSNPLTSSSHTDTLAGSASSAPGLQEQVRTLERRYKKLVDSVADPEGSDREEPDAEVLRGKLFALKKLLKTEREKQAKLSTSEASLRSVVDGLRTKNVELTRQVQDLEDIKNENDQLKKKATAAEKAAKKRASLAEQEMLTLQRETKQLVQQKEDLEAKVEELEAQLVDLSAKQADAPSQPAFQDQPATVDVEVYEAAERDHREKVANLLEEIHKLQSDQDKALAASLQVHELQDEVRTLREQLNTAQERLNISAEDSAEAKSEMQQRVDELLAEREKILTAFEKREEKYKATRKELKEMTKQAARAFELENELNGLKEGAGMSEKNGSVPLPESYKASLDEAVREERKKLKEAISERDAFEKALSDQMTTLFECKRDLDAMKGKVMVCAQIVEAELEADTPVAIVPSQQPGVVTVVGADSYQVDVVYSGPAVIKTLLSEAKGSLRSVGEGESVSVIMLGPTDTGKTAFLSELLPKALNDVFKGIEKSVVSKKVTGRSFVSCVELASNGLHDLGKDISMVRFPEALPPLPIDCVSLDPYGYVQIEGCTQVAVKNAKEAWSNYCTMSSNRRERRSHIFFSLHYQATMNDSRGTYYGKCTFVDLSGPGLHSDEAPNANDNFVDHSVSTLENVLDEKFGRQSSSPILKDNILATLMSDVLGGNSHTHVFLFVDPVKRVPENVRMLEIGQKAAMVKNFPQKHFAPV